MSFFLVRWFGFYRNWDVESYHLPNLPNDVFPTVWHDHETVGREEGFGRAEIRYISQMLWFFLMILDSWSISCFMVLYIYVDIVLNNILKKPGSCAQWCFLHTSEESMSIFHFATSFGPVQLLCIGEWSVQSFRPSVLAGASVKRMDEIGYFDVGSQVILALPKGLQLLPKEGARVFVGDPIARCEDPREKMLAWHVIYQMNQHELRTSFDAVCCGTNCSGKKPVKKVTKLKSGKKPCP